MLSSQQKEKKEWQKGYDIDYLLELENFYKIEYNRFTHSPFTEMKKHIIANDLSKGELQLFHKGKNPILSYHVSTVKVRTPIKMYQDIVIGYKEIGDKIFSKICGSKEEFKHRIENAYLTNNCWIYIWAEDKEWHSFIQNECGFDYIGSKFTSFGEIYSIFFKDKKDTILKRSHLRMPEIEKIDLKEIKPFSNFEKELKEFIEKVGNELNNINFTNHYSNYNKNNSWSALSLIGYSNDPGFIAKPIEMSKKWKEKNKDENFFLQKTPLYDKFKPELTNLLSIIFKRCDPEYHRIRLMKLTPNSGELERHTDQVDPESGNNIGKLARFHIPLFTNDDVWFMCWGYNGNLKKNNMKVGECWILDTRKPHSVINKGTTDRIHLVIDIRVNEKIKELILGE